MRNVQLGNFGVGLVTLEFFLAQQDRFCEFDLQMIPIS